MGILSNAINNQTDGSTISTSADLAAFLIHGGFDSTAGISVTPTTAMGVAAWSSGVSLIAEAIAQLPLKVYKRLQPEGKEVAMQTAIWRVLHDKPNGFQNSFEWREMMTLHLVLWANCYSIKTFNARREILEMLPVHPTRVKPKLDSSFNVVYEVRGPEGQVETFPKSRIFHIKDRQFGDNMAEGRPRILDAKNTLGLALAAEKWGGQLFGNGARPSGLISTEEPVGDEEGDRIIESWTKAHGGDNALGTAILDNGFKWTPLVMNNTDAQFLETRKFQIAETARILRINPVLLGENDKASLNNAETFGIQFIKFTLLPWIRRWESAINDQCIAESKRGEIFAEFLVDGLERGDSASRTAYYTAGLRDGWLNPNEVRGKENMNPIDDPSADEYRRAESIHGPEDEENDIDEPEDPDTEEEDTDD